MLSDADLFCILLICGTGRGRSLAIGVIYDKTKVTLDSWLLMELAVFKKFESKVFSCVRNR